MPALTLLLPASIPPADVLADIFKGVDTAVLARLLNAASDIAVETVPDPWLRSLPHERWLARAAGLPVAPDGAVPMAPWLRLADLGEAPQADTVCLELVHIHAARDHLLLTDPAQLEVDADEAAALLDAARPALASLSGNGDAGDPIASVHFSAAAPGRWYLQHPGFAACTSTSVQRATELNIDIWLPEGEAARAWRRVQNEIQMLWHDHPINRKREAHGLLPINSLWMYGGRADAQIDPAGARLPFDQAAGDMPLPFAQGLAHAAGVEAVSVHDLQPANQRSLQWFLGLQAPLRADDWHAWQQSFAALDARWLQPALAALKARRLDTLTLVLASDGQWLQATVRAADLWKFWRKQALLTTLQRALAAQRAC